MEPWVAGEQALPTSGGTMSGAKSVVAGRLAPSHRRHARLWNPGRFKGGQAKFLLKSCNIFRVLLLRKEYEWTRT